MFAHPSVTSAEGECRSSYPPARTPFVLHHRGCSLGDSHMARKVYIQVGRRRLNVPARGVKESCS
jgi:hypothetical protein